MSIIRYDCVGYDAGMQPVNGGNWVRHHDHEKALREARMKVKPLVWEAYTTDEGTDGWQARTSIGRYLAVQSGWFLVGQSGWNEAETAFAAKAAAQADYEARILSALDLNPTQFIGGNND